MTNIQHVFEQATLPKLPMGDQLPLVDDRLLKIADFQVAGKHFPDSTFSVAGLTLGKAHGLTATLADHALTIGAGKQQLVLQPTALVVFLQEIRAQNVVPTLAAEPEYNTIIGVQGAQRRPYLKVFGSRLALYLVAHPQEWPVVDLLGLKALALDDQAAEAVCARKVTAYGYSRLVKGTEVAWLDSPAFSPLRVRPT